VRNGEQLWMIDAGDGTGRVVAPEDRRAKLGIDGSRLYRRLVGTGLCPSTALSRLLRPSPRFDCVVDEVDTGLRESVQVAVSLGESETPHPVGSPLRHVGVCWLPAELWVRVELLATDLRDSHRPGCERI
jgi:hypothetical protein